MKRPSLILGGLLTALLVGCSLTQPPKLPATKGHLNHPHLDHAAAEAWLRLHSDSATFISRNGRLYGMDSDAMVTFKDRHQVEVTEFGYAPQTYTGVYTIAPDGKISVRLKDYKSGWPDMYLSAGPKSAFLMPADQDPSFRMGDRAGAVTTSDMAPYWPFRQRQG